MTRILRNGTLATGSVVLIGVLAACQRPRASSLGSGSAAVATPVQAREPTFLDAPPSPVASQDGSVQPARADETRKAEPPGDDSMRNVRIVFLHHSTGGIVWKGGVQEWFNEYNSTHGTSYAITERKFPEPYGWRNYPYDYYNIWVAHAGAEPHKGDPTLEILTRDYDVVVFKHCYPVSALEPEAGPARVDSDRKTLGNYKLQYGALRTKLRGFPRTRFVVWTGAAHVEANTDPEKARRARDFFAWVKDAWDEPGDNIFVWDFWQLETGGGLYLLPQHARSPTDSHPSPQFAQQVAPLFGRRVVDVIEGRGDSGSLTGG